MHNQATNTLKQYFGFDTFREGQQQVIDYLLAGHSAAAVFPTGGGKSLCYQLPALLLPGVTLVVSPLIALMKDQIDALTAKGIAARRLDSTLSLDEYREVMDEVRSGQLRLLYVAPERFNNERFRAAIRDINVSLFAIDEAHCISEWGHNFRPDYLKLAMFAQQCNAKCLLALTATATNNVLTDICRNLSINPQHATRTSFYRPNLTLRTTAVSPLDRDAFLLSELQSNSAGAAIIYVTLQKTAEEVAAKLAAAGLPAMAYHAGMNSEERHEIQECFMRSKNAITVATIAFGMGIDKANIRYVYHYNLPKSLENYAQEIGRGGRDGETAICHLLACSFDLNVLENFVFGDTPAETSVNSLVHDIFSRDEHFDINMTELANRHDIRPLVLRTLMTYLELDGYLQGGTPFYSDYRFKPLMPSGEILTHFQGERRDFLANLLRQSTKAKTWFTIDPAQVAQRLNTPRERVIKALDYLGEKSMLEVKAAGVRLRYNRLKLPDNHDHLVDTLQQRIEKRENNELDRLQQVMDFASLDSCQSNALSTHFGEALAEKCGHCTGCLGPKVQLDEREGSNIPADLHIKLENAKTEIKLMFTDPRTLTRFVCGVTSPKISKARLSKHPLFGSFSHIPFKQVLKSLNMRYFQNCDS